MAKWTSASMLRGSLNYIQSTATQMHVLKNYTIGDSYATVINNSLGYATMTSSDYTISANGLNQQIISAAKSITAVAPSGTSPDLHFAFTDGSANVIWVTDETSNQEVRVDNIMNVPSLTYVSYQPT